MHAFWNNMKTTMLMAGLMGLALAIGAAIGGPNAMVLALVVGAGMNLVAFFFSDKIALATVRAKPVTRQEDPQLWDMVEHLAERAQIPMPKLYVSPAAAPNAFATGRSPRHSAVCVTAGLRQTMDMHQLQGVIAHELAHVKNRDILISTIAAIVAGAISLVASMMFWFGGSSRDDDERGGNPLVAILIMILAPIAAGVIQMAISRSREYEADRMGAELVGTGRGLASALAELDAASRRIPLPVPDSQANMFIVAPLTGSRMLSLYSTHPPIGKRIERLQALERSL